MYDTHTSAVAATSVPAPAARNPGSPALVASVVSSLNLHIAACTWPFETNRSQPNVLCEMLACGPAERVLRRVPRPCLRSGIFTGSVAVLLIWYGSSYRNKLLLHQD